MIPLVITCEHGGREVPGEYVRLFENKEDVLETHRGYDLNALALFEYIRDLGVFSLSNTLTRLLIDFNRSPDNPELFSSFSRGLGEEEKRVLLEHYYHPYRRKVRDRVRGLENPVHIAVHSFTRVFEGMRRETDIGFLFDPARKGEEDFCRIWKKKLNNHDPQLKIHYNSPYEGISDGLPTALRADFPFYCGIELEVCQDILSPGVNRLIRQTLIEAMNSGK